MSNVLIIEDHADVAESLRLLLELQGMKCEWAAALSTALTRLATPGVDCVVLDLTLPDAAGLEAVHALQAKFPAVPVVVNTGYPELAVPAIHAGAQDAVVKPGDPEVWQRRIEYAIARHQVRRAYAPYIDALKSAIATADRMAAGDTK